MHDTNCLPYITYLQKTHNMNDSIYMEANERKMYEKIYG